MVGPGSIWLEGHDVPPYPRLSGDMSTQVLVIGGGLAGLLIAYRLQQEGIDTVLVEQDRICHGTTGHTTAKITAQHGLIYSKLLKAYGKDHTRMYYDANREAVEHLKQLCKTFGTRLEVKDNFIYSTDEHKLEEELAALQKLDIRAKYQKTPPLPIPTAGAVGLAAQGQFHPLELARHLVKDLTVFEHTKVTEMLGTTAVTAHGRIRAQKVVVCTHFPFLNKHGSYFLKLYQHRSYLLALEGAEPLPAMYVDDSKEGFSFSSFGPWLLLGGGGHRTGKQGGSYQALRDLRERFYVNARERCHWAAQDTMSLDGIPYIGNYSRNTPDLYVAAGFNKWGMTGSMVAAQIITSQLQGRPKDYAPVFSPSRSILKPQLLVNGFETTKTLLTPTAPRCPHLGCALKYNTAEHSWDCPCHGSRFSETGKVLDNPANGDLKR